MTDFCRHLILLIQIFTVTFNANLSRIARVKFLDFVLLVKLVKLNLLQNEVTSQCVDVSISCLEGMD